LRERSSKKLISIIFVLSYFPEATGRISFDSFTRINSLSFSLVVVLESKSTQFGTFDVVGRTAVGHRVLQMLLTAVVVARRRFRLGRQRSSDADDPLQGTEEPTSILPRPRLWDAASC
jgi:hypothetical protein